MCICVTRVHVCACVRKSQTNRRNIQKHQPTDRRRNTQKRVETHRNIQKHQPNNQPTNQPTNQLVQKHTETYRNIQKHAETRRVRLTVGGDQIDYPGAVTTKTTDLITAKLLINSVISTDGAKFMGIDIKDFYLNNELPRKEYIRIAIKLIPEEIIELYNLRELEHNGFVYAEVSKGMYGLPQAGRVASDALIPRLQAAGYQPAKYTPGLFIHDENSIIFCLCVDDFGVQYTEKKDAEHLRDTLQKDYKITEDWEGTNYCGIDINWNYEEGWVDTDMTGYGQRGLTRFNHPKPSRPQHSPSKWTEPTYGAKVQMADGADTSEPLTAEGITRIQQIVGYYLYYGRAIDSTQLIALGTIGTAMSKATENTNKAVTHFLDYVATHPEATVRFYKSDMVLRIDSDASYLSEPNARSRVGGYFYLDGEEDPPPDKRPNGAVHVECAILKNIMSSAAESETGGLFVNAQTGCPIQVTLKEMKHPQSATPLCTDNTTVDGFTNDKIKPKRTKAMDMRFHWIKDRVKQGQYRVLWSPGKDNKGDYFTKHHPPSHHINMRPIYLQTPESECEGVLISDPRLNQSRVPHDSSQPESQTVTTHSREQHAGAPAAVAKASHIGAQTHLVRLAR